ncbi:MAG: long-chain fatty acid--CoA ligase [Patescibacteria group bacterium]|jgi:long-chain acyl-CoA synthetase|nr:long-chain fatty acid--CoA ligase [Patescibacteria group bacterium]
MKKQKELWEPFNLADLFYTSTERFANNEALKFRIGHHYETLSYFELKKETIKLALALKKMGFKAGDKAIIFSENRPEWVITDLALITLGAINVPIHSVLSPAQLETIIKEIKPKALFLSNHELSSKLLEISKTISAIPLLFSFEKIESDGFEKLFYFKKVIEESQEGEKSEAELIESSLKISPKSVATIIYTSGTTGRFKGVKLTHQNLISNAIGVLRYVGVLPEDRFFSILPLSHVFERTIGYYIPLYSGASIGYATDLAKISQEIKDRKPTIVIAVPRLFEKIYEKILEKVNKNLAKKVIFRFAFGLKKNGRHQHLEKIFENLVFSKVRAEFGGQIRFFVSGGAALPVKLGKFFDQVGLIILEGYGLTETSPVISCNRLGDYSFGTVGPVLEGVEVKFNSTGEILTKGSNTTPGYIQDNDTKKAFTKDGWFKTGDYGFFDRKGFLVLTGRKKDLIVLSTGKKVAPTNIESQLESSEYIEQAFVFGDARKHVGAVIVPNLEKFSEKFGINGPQHLVKSQIVRDYLYQEVQNLLKNYASYEKIHKFIIQAEPFSIESGELTPKFGLRRHVIYERNLDEIEKIYQK